MSLQHVWLFDHNARVDERCRTFFLVGLGDTGDLEAGVAREEELPIGALGRTIRLVEHRINQATMGASQHLDEQQDMIYARGMQGEDMVTVNW